MSLNSISPGILGGGAPTGDQVWEGLGVAFDDDPSRVGELRRALRQIATDTIPSAAPWSTRNGEGSYAGTATVNVGGSVDFECIAAATQILACAGRAPWRLRPNTILAARLSAFSSSSASDFIFFALTNALNVQSPLSGVEINGAGGCRVFREGGTGTSAVTVASITGGQGWAILIARGDEVDGFVAVGSGGDFPDDDSTWTYLGTVARGLSVSAPWPLYAMQLNRDAGSGNVTATVTGFSYGEWI